jgi:hypothetical protein
VTLDLPTIDFTPLLPRPGDTLNFAITLPSGVYATQLTLVLKEVYHAMELMRQDVGPAELGEESVLSLQLRLPADVEPGYYILYLIQRVGQDESAQVREIAERGLIIADKETAESSAAEELALELTTKAVEAAKNEDTDEAIVLLRSAAFEYERSGSLGCAGLALADLVTLSRACAINSHSFLDQAWQALSLLLLAGDTVSASGMLKAICELSAEIPDVVARFVDLGRSYLDSCDAEDIRLEERREKILRVAQEGLPRPMGATLQTIRKDFQRRLTDYPAENQYQATDDALLVLATSQIAVYTRRVILRNRQGWVIQVTALFSALGELGVSLDAWYPPGRFSTSRGSPLRSR